MTIPDGSLLVTSPRNIYRDIHPSVMVVARNRAPTATLRTYYLGVILNWAIPRITLGDVWESLACTIPHPRKFEPYSGADLSAYPLFQGGPVRRLRDRSQLNMLPMYVFQDVRSLDEECVRFGDRFGLLHSNHALCRAIERQDPSRYKILVSPVFWEKDMLEHSVFSACTQIVEPRDDLIFPSDGVTGDDMWRRAVRSIEPERGFLSKSYVDPALSAGAALTLH